MKLHNVKWAVGLSNGQNAYEEKGDFVTVAGELSPWNKLLKYCEDNSLTITSLSLYTDDGKTFNLHSLGKNPKFKAFDIGIKPCKLALERKYASDIDKLENPDLFTTICAWYDLGHCAEFGDVKIKLSIWVDENNPNNSWSLVTVE